MWVWVRGMRISRGDDTSPVANDHISRREIPHLPREIRHFSTGDVADLQNFGSVTLLDRPEGGKFFPEDLDASLCTHIIYAFTF
jgi:hypothetical protein